ncbi:MAG: ribulose-phosphate 3-epimerase [Bacteroidetes bacterium]|nr:ribulose-phosphate 3-epimerase [Bacteroidota bacterium]
MKRLIAPSILAANFLELGTDIELLNKSDADWIHVDVMDGRFVPNISFGMPIIKAVKTIAKKPLDVHLMIEEPGKYFNDFKAAGADILTVHYEACPHLHKDIQTIHNLGMKAGIALNPHTPLNVLEEIVPDVDLILIMSVNPGFGGQSFIKGSISKISRLRNMIDKTGSKALIEVDGGVDLNNAKILFDAGVNVLVAGSSVFGSTDPMDTITRLKKC